MEGTAGGDVILRALASGCSMMIRGAECVKLCRLNRRGECEAVRSNLEGDDKGEGMAETASTRRAPTSKIYDKSVRMDVLRCGARD
jgi:hypothetical protein